MRDRPDFPTMEMVNKAKLEQLAKWHRFLPMGLSDAESRKVAKRIEQRIRELGGIPKELDEKIGYF
jgi:hypothetical protein